MKISVHLRGASTAFGIVLFLSCGAKKKSDSTLSSINVSAASEVANDAVNEATEATADSGAQGILNFSGSADAEVDTTAMTKSCVATDGGGATVTLTASGAATRERIVVRKAGSKAFKSRSEISGTEVRTWTKSAAGSDISCSTANGANIRWNSSADIVGLKLDVDVARSRIQETTMTTIESVKTKNMTHTVKGKRKIEFMNQVATAAQVSITKKVTLVDLKRLIDGADFDGGSATASATTSTKELEPLMIEVVRDTSSSSFVWKSRTVVSGTLVSLLDDGSRIESTFANVLYSKLAENVCIPISGTVSGEIFDARATTAAHSFTITFESTKATKTVDGVEDTTYSPSQSCDLSNE